jgi:hypothetical protein
MQDAPNVGQNDSLNDPEVKDKEVNFIFFFNSIFSSNSLFVLIDLSFVFVGRIERGYSPRTQPAKSTGGTKQR